jgi:hypothetical protein
MTTYLIERKNNLGHDVLEYCTTLKDAKHIASNMRNLNGVSILCIKGPSFGEGFHQYRTIPVLSKYGRKWKRITSKLSQY